MRLIQKLIFVTILTTLTISECRSQQIGIKTNLISDATASPGIGAEISVAPRWSLEVTGSLNAWDMPSERKWKHWLIEPEVRYWFCEALHGHFVGMHLLGGQYNIGGFGFDGKLFGIDFNTLRDTRRQGWAAGGGINYGYAWMLSKHWNLEAELGVGYLFTVYDVYKCAGCGKMTDRDVTRHYFGPTELAINLEYIF